MPDRGVGGGAPVPGLDELYVASVTAAAAARWRLARPRRR
jgi:hypothetical protein